jgi:transposase-like protein
MGLGVAGSTVLARRNLRAGSPRGRCPSACWSFIGATPEGKKELVGLIDRVRESAQSWRELLLDLKRRGLSSACSLRSTMARSASGRQEHVWPNIRAQRCWVHYADLRIMPTYGWIPAPEGVIATLGSA